MNEGLRQLGIEDIEVNISKYDWFNQSLDLSKVLSYCKTLNLHNKKHLDLLKAEILDIIENNISNFKRFVIFNYDWFNFFLDRHKKIFNHEWEIRFWKWNSVPEIWLNHNNYSINPTLSYFRSEFISINTLRVSEYIFINSNKINKFWLWNISFKLNKWKFNPGLNIDNEQSHEYEIKHIYTENLENNLRISLFNCAINILKLEHIQNVNNLNISSIFWFDWSSSMNLIKINDIITYSNDNSKYLINNVKTDVFHIENIKNLSSNFEIRNVEIDYLIIKNSDLWRLTLNWVKIWRLTIQNVVLNNCIFNWVEFSDYNLWNDEWKILDLNIKDNYRQLKHVMDKNWNYTEANRFYANEMKSYGKTLSWEKDYFNKMIHSFQYHVSDFWSSWAKALVSLLLFVLISSIIDFIYWEFIVNRYESTNVLEYINSFFYVNSNYINPLFLLDNVNINYNSIDLYWFFIYKVIYWTIVYQLIISIRRTTRR